MCRKCKTIIIVLSRFLSVWFKFIMKSINLEEYKINALSILCKFFAEFYRIAKTYGTDIVQTRTFTMKLHMFTWNGDSFAVRFGSNFSYWLNSSESSDTPNFTSKIWFEFCYFILCFRILIKKSKFFKKKTSLNYLGAQKVLKQITNILLQYCLTRNCKYWHCSRWRNAKLKI